MKTSLSKEQMAVAMGIAPFRFGTLVLQARRLGFIVEKKENRPAV